METAANDQRTRWTQRPVAVALFSFVVVVLINLSLIHFDRDALGGDLIQIVSSCFGGASLYPLLETYVLYRLIRSLSERIDRWPLAYVFPAAFFALWMVEGRHFDTKGSVDFFSQEKFFVALCLLAACGYLVVYYLVFVAADLLMLKVSPHLPAHAQPNRSRLVGWFREHPFAATLILLAAIAIPLYFISYPALFMGDTRRQVRQALGMDQLYNMHPILHTLVIRLCLRLGLSLGGSYNLGMFLCVVLQGIVLVCAVAFCVRTLVRDVGLRGYVALSVPVFLVVHPRCFQYLVQVTKDTLYCAFLLLFVCCTIRQLYDKATRHEFYAWVACALAVSLFRREGVLIVVPTVLVVALIRTHRAKALALVVVTLTFLAVWDNVVMPRMDVKPGSIRVAYSLVFQGTARYVKKYPGDVTPAERDAIDAVLHYDSLAKRYRPKLADHVIRTYRPEATPQDLVRYFVATAHMFRRHPDAFLLAIAANKYKYFYPSASYSTYYSLGLSLDRMALVNASTGVTDFFMPALQQRLYGTFENVREGFWHLPGFGLLISSYIATLATAFLFTFAARRRLRYGLVLTVMPLMQVLIMFAGPTNGAYFRYTFPLVMVLPVVVMFLCGCVQDGDEPKAWAAQSLPRAAANPSTSEDDSGAGEGDEA